MKNTEKYSLNNKFTLGAPYRRNQEDQEAGQGLERGQMNIAC